MNTVTVPPATEPSPAAPAPTTPPQTTPPQTAPATPPADNSFAELVRRERHWIDGLGTGPRRPDDFRVSTAGAGGEPWIWFTSRDCFGIALSGGGIRSATFNLGLLQALEEKRLLARADYLSTVSGGGYVGGFLTAWRQRHPNSSFPSRATGTTDLRESAPIRHLREFSRFLIPRKGLFHADTWNAVVTVLGGLLPSLLTAFALIMLGVAAWLGLGYWLSSALPPTGAAAMAGLTLVALFVSEWRRSRAGKSTLEETVAFVILSVPTTLSVALLWMVVGYKDQVANWAKSVGEAAAPVLQSLPDVGSPHHLLAWLAGHFDLWSNAWAGRDAALRDFGGAFAPALAWLAVVGVLLFVRTFYSRVVGIGSHEKPVSNWSGVVDRVITTCLLLALAWTVMAGLWLAAHALLLGTSARVSTVVVGAGAAASAGLFARLREWLNAPVVETRASSLTRKLLAMVRPNVPQVLAFAAVLLLVLVACLVLHREFGVAHVIPALVGGCLLTVLLTLLIFDPARVGMHDFYRARICRCYLGASRANANDYSRATSEQPGDDLRLDSLGARADASDSKRPLMHQTLQLICCTANNMSGDVLSGLYRGGRSAVLSANGVALGNTFRPAESLRLSSALTASAAAFNSQMGRVSMDLGPAVGFMMCALNLRLGLWVRHPLNPCRGARMLSGLPLFYEMFGLTSCDVPVTKAADDDGFMRTTLRKLSETSREASHRFRDLHLSDGGHFENLGLYELVRRHCRYIIVSDCGADPHVTFDDLAIALRSVREDFGVEIDIDVSPLRRDENGRARQHAVVGTIHYDGSNGLDKGTLLYIKPALTGDEPPDVLQYQARNDAFPHQSTGDQFYDEAQWESYRRLGQHSGNIVLRFIDKFSRRQEGTQFIENVFLEATRLWHPAPERQSEVFLELTQRCADLEADIRANAALALRLEFFPEAQTTAAADKNAAGQTPPEDHTQVLYFLMRTLQLMEDVWVGAELETYWSHPLNDGWMNYFHRWASTPSFRRWWPILRPIYSIGFRDFVRERFGLTYEPGQIGTGARLELKEGTPTGTGMAWESWRQLNRGVDPKDCKVLEYWLTLEQSQANATPLRLLVGLLLYRESATPRAIEWKNGNLFVPPSLNGAGIIARFLTAVIDRFKTASTLQVIFEGKLERGDPPTRLRRLHEVNFYKSRGFVNPEPAGDELRLVLTPPTQEILRIAVQTATA